MNVLAAILGWLRPRPAQPLWIICPHCENYWCTMHSKHAFECPCPPLDELERGGIDPYL